MAYSITTRDGITLNNIPDDVDPNSDQLKKRVADIRAAHDAGASFDKKPATTPAVVKSKPKEESVLDTAGRLGKQLLQDVGGSIRTGMVGVTDLIPNQRRHTEALADWMGLPKDQNTPFQQFTRGVGQAVPFLLGGEVLAGPKLVAEAAGIGRAAPVAIGPATTTAKQAIGTALKAQPKATLVASGAGNVAAEQAKEQGAGVAGQVGASLLAGITTMGAATGIKRVLESTGTSMDDLIKSGIVDDIATHKATTEKELNRFLTPEEYFKVKKDSIAEIIKTKSAELATAKKVKKGKAVKLTKDMKEEDKYRINSKEKELSNLKSELDYLTGKQVQEPDLGLAWQQPKESYAKQGEVPHYIKKEYEDYLVTRYKQEGTLPEQVLNDWPEVTARLQKEEIDKATSTFLRGREELAGPVADRSLTPTEARQSYPGGVSYPHAADYEGGIDFYPRGKTTHPASEAPEYTTSGKAEEVAQRRLEEIDQGFVQGKQLHEDEIAAIKREEEDMMWARREDTQPSPSDQAGDIYTKVLDRTGDKLAAESAAKNVFDRAGDPTWTAQQLSLGRRLGGGKQGGFVDPAVFAIASQKLKQTTKEVRDFLQNDAYKFLAKEVPMNTVMGTMAAIASYNNYSNENPMASTMDKILHAATWGAVGFAAPSLIKHGLDLAVPGVGTRAYEAVDVGVFEKVRRKGGKFAQIKDDVAAEERSTGIKLAGFVKDKLLHHSTNEQRLMYLLSQGDVDAGKVEPLLKDLTEESMKRIRALSMEAAKVGLISEDQVLKNVNYLSRTYESKLYKPSMAATIQRKLKIVGNEFKSRGYTKEVSAKEKDKWIDHFTTMNPKEPPKIEKTYFDKATGKEKVVIRAYLNKEQRTKLGEVENMAVAVSKTAASLIHDTAVHKVFSEVSKDKSLAVSIEDIGPDTMNTLAEQGWKVLPSDTVKDTSIRKYGELAGKLVHPDVYFDLRSAQFLRDASNYTIMRIIGLPMQAWKQFHTVYSVPTVVANIVGGPLTYFVAGGGSKGFTKAVATFSNTNAPANRELIDLATTHGIFSSGFKENELAGMSKNMLAEIAAKGNVNSIEDMLGASGKAVFAVTSAVKKTHDLAVSGYTAPDDFWRFAKFVDNMEKGEEVQLAARNAIRTSIDYRIDAPVISLARTTAFPFISFAYRLPGRFLEASFKNPARLLGASAGIYAANSLLTQGIDPEKIKEEKKLLRHPTLSFRIGETEDKRGKYVDISNYIPGAAYFEDEEYFKTIKGAPSYIQPGGAYMDMLKAATGRDLATGIKTKDPWTEFGRAMVPQVLPGSTQSERFRKKEIKAYNQPFGQGDLTKNERFAARYGVKIEAVKSQAQLVQDTRSELYYMRGDPRKDNRYASDKKDTIYGVVNTYRKDLASKSNELGRPITPEEPWFKEYMRGVIKDTEDRVRLYNETLQKRKQDFPKNKDITSMVELNMEDILQLAAEPLYIRRDQ